MKRKSILTAVLALFGTMAFAQATLPTSESFTGFTGTFTQPGWTFSNVSGTSYTYAGGQVGVAGKLDATGEYIEVIVGGQMGNVTYYLKGQNTGGAWLGTFKVRESFDGTTWTDMAVYTGATAFSSTAFTQYTVNPLAASRRVRFEFTTKAASNNVAIDEINITAGVSSAQDINMKYNTTSILSGGTTPIFGSPVGTPLPLNFSVENTGLATLGVTSVSFTGTDAADFSVTSPVGAFNVNATSNTPLVVSFNPSAPGTRVADMIVANDDADEGTYVIHLNAIGGTLATEPASQPTNLNFSNIKSYRARYTFSAASGNPTGYLIVRKTSASPITDVPTDGVWYQRGDAVGTSKVVATGTTLSNALMNVYAGQTYQLAIYAYNGSGTYTNYNTTNFLTGSFTSLSSMMPPTEYNGITTSSPTFLTDLSAHINPHSSTFYSNYDETMINLFTARDTTAGQKVFNCVYSGEAYIYTEPMAWGYMSREHSYCHQWMPTNPADGTGAAPNNVERPEYNDQHHLFPTNQNDVNAERSNYPYGEVVTVQSTYLLGKSGLDALGHKVYEPCDAHKGNSARAVMYMATCYNGKNDAFGAPQNWKFKNPISGTIAYGQDQEVLKAWHYMDPPDAYEIARNDFLDSLQGNRNPFIDSMQFACYIDFSTMTKIAGPAPCGSFVGLNNKAANEVDFSVFPNPSAGTFSVLLNSEVGDYTINVIDITGRIVDTQNVKAKQNTTYVSFTNKVLPAGSYFVEINSSKSKSVKKLIVQ